MCKPGFRPEKVKGTGMSGRVTIMGAGPGDADYLTLKAVKALQAADVVLFDHLVCEEVLALARPDAWRLAVGKRARRKSCSQEEIHARMLALARQGLHVVRLKGGDPMIFGRANEEIAHLRRAGVAVEVVAGITAAAAFAASLGVSLTERGKARSVRYVTGHAASGELPQDLDWQGLTDPGTTLVIYMGGHTAGRLARRLMLAGLPAATPVVVASNVARPGERRRYLRLSQLQDGPAHADGPVLIGVGEVFAEVVAMHEAGPREASPHVRQAAG